MPDSFAVPHSSTPLVDVPLAHKVEFLSDPEHFPDPTDTVESIETHFSWVFLTRTRAYKLKKPVRTEVLDFRTIEARRLNCLEELRLNRRLAPSIYLDVIPLTRTDGALRLGNEGRAVDWLVKMRRLPARRMLDRAIAEGTLRGDALPRAVRRLVDFYAALPPEPLTGEAYRNRFLADAEAIRTCFARAPQRLAEAARELTAALGAFVAARPEYLDARVTDGRIIEGHGDLRPEHVYVGEPPVFIDCLEFNRAFRILDPVDELSFLAMECERLGAPQLSEQILDTYFTARGDHAPAPLMAFYKAFRAGLRGKLAFQHTQDSAVSDHAKWLSRAADYLALGRRHLPRPSA